MKIVLPWLCAAAALAGVGGLYVSNTKLSTELAQLRADNQELQQAKAANEASAAQGQAQNEELARLRKDNEDLLRLRNEARQLRQEKQQLAAQLQSAQGQAQNAQARAQAAQGQGQPRVWNAATGTLVAGSTNLAPSLSAEQLKAQEAFRARYGLQTTQMLTGEQVVINACVNNLRQIEGAKQQWALENSKPANTLVGELNITPYLPGNVMPTCPGGGTYTINSVGVAPTCSVAGHQLMK
jgi:hypothetical protein